MHLNKKSLALLLFVLLYGLIGYLTFSGRMQNYVLLSFLTAGGICGIFFLSFERRRPALRDIMPIVVVCTVASLGRVVFSFIPQVQPVTAIVIIMGMTYGPQTGFLTGTLSALISNLFLGQGPWTPWQMLAWGTIGCLAGFLGKWKFGKRLPAYCAFGFLSAFLYSIITDIWTLASLGQALNLPVIATVFAGGALFNLTHAVGNVIFLPLLFAPFNRKLERMKTKYGILSDN